MKCGNFLKLTIIFSSWVSVGRDIMGDTVYPTHGQPMCLGKEQFSLLLEVPTLAIHLKREFFMFFLQFPTPQF